MMYCFYIYIIEFDLLRNFDLCIYAVLDVLITKLYDLFIFNQSEPLSFNIAASKLINKL